MENNNSPKRRASEPKVGGEALALVSSSNSVYNRIPTPLPYLPSDYRPSPDSPRHFLGPQPVLFETSAKRQRSHSIGHPLAIEHENSSQQQHQFELVPYHDWAVIARDNQRGQLVLYNQDNQSVTVQKYLPNRRLSPLVPDKPIQLGKDLEECPYCHRPLTDDIKKPKVFEADYMDRNYFRLLASSQTNSVANSPVQSRSSTFSSASPINSQSAQNLNANAFNQGYYSKFFVEVNKLGKGFRGSVFLCEHMLDGVKLGKYAIKKVAIGNNHPWLVRMLREVHLLERLRHPNIVSYKHSWLEYNRLTAFGPEVPCLFILMECANGGNLEEYFEMPVNPKSETSRRASGSSGSSSGSSSNSKPMTAKELKRERIKRQLREQASFEQESHISSPVVHEEKRLLTMTEIWSLFLDIVQGLAHLHQQNIVHRDLKPPNLLLQYDDRNRNGHRGIPRVLISDFGECEDLDETEQDDENRTGATGTLEFMAPEHAKLDPRGRNTVDYSPKADMWSLGMVLYYLCYSRLPYSVIADVDILRNEILSFKDVRFPASRFDIYPHSSQLYKEAVQDPTLQSDIPNELKLLIRMLLSIDPSKRPSCNEILSKIRRIQRDDNTTVFQDMPKDWNTNNKSSTVVQDDNKESPNEDDGSVTSSSTGTTKRGKEKEQPVIEHLNEKLRKRQRLLHHELDSEGDTVMTNTEPEETSPRLLLGSPVLMERKWLTDDQVAKAIKTLTAVLKIASCTYSCSPYSTRSTTLYPLLFFALLDFWHESNSPSTLLIVLHIVWIMTTTLFSSGLCEA